MSYENNYNSGGNLPYCDPVLLNDDPGSYVEDSIKETLSVDTGSIHCYRYTDYHQSGHSTSFD
eukprot:14157802-Ditylum_brightwellii.AAC.1